MKRLLIILFLGGGLLASARALEVDCAACDFCRGRMDLVGPLDARLRAHLAAGRSVAEIAAAEGGTNLQSVLRPPAERWANDHPAAVRPDPARLKYRGSKLPQNWFFTSYEPCVRVAGHCLGTDKLGHLFQQGWEYYRIAVLDGRGQAVAERYGEWLEGMGPRDSYRDLEPYFRRQLSGGLVGYGGFGRTMSGVISRADLAANLAGLRLYQDLAGGRFETLGDYLSDALCEETNTNLYTAEMEQVVRRNTPAAPESRRFSPASTPR